MNKCISRFQQQGAVLVVGLITLTVMTLMVISMLRTSVLELKIGGSYHHAEEMFSNAEMALRLFINSSPTYYSGCLTAAPAISCFFRTPPANGVGDLGYTTVQTDNQGNLYANVTGLGANQDQTVKLTATQQGNCIEPPKSSLCSGQSKDCIKIAIFDISADSRGALSGKVVVHQGISALGLAASCP